MATSPSDSSNRNVLAWLDRLKTSVQAAGSKGGPGAFSLDGRFPLNGDRDDDSDQEEHVSAHRLTHAQRYGLAPVDEGDGDELEGGGEHHKNSGGDEDALQSSLPDSHVPLGLIANLSLSNNKKVRSLKKNREEGKDLTAEALDEDNLDDDNVVSIHPYSVSFNLSDFA